MTTVAFTRPEKRLEESITIAEKMGFNVLSAPSLEIMDGCPEDFEKTKGLLASGKVDHVIFGSATGVEECTRAYGKGFGDMLQSIDVISIGPNTSRALKEAGIRVDSVPEDYSSYGLVELLGSSVKGQTVLLIRSDMGSKVLSEGLVGNGAIVEELAAYRLKPIGRTDDLDKIMEGMRNGEVDAMAFTSPMSADSFFMQLSKKYGGEADAILARTCIAAIGLPTARKLTDLGRAPDIVPERTTFVDMLAAIRDRFDNRE